MIRDEFWVTTRMVIFIEELRTATTSGSLGSQVSLLVPAVGPAAQAATAAAQEADHFSCSWVM